MTVKAELVEPSLGLLCKLGSIVVHADEITENDGKNAHQFDISAIRQLLGLTLRLRHGSKAWGRCCPTSGARDDVARTIQANA